MTDKQFLQKIKRTAHAILPEGARVVLFGSRARGDNRKDSDWDILVLLDKERVERKDYDLYSYPLKQMGWDLEMAVNPLLFTKEDWTKRHRFTDLFHNVELEGIEL